MNRIKISPLATDELFESGQNFQANSSLDCLDQFSNPSSGVFSLFAPMHYEKNYSYPLIVWLHSNGQDAEQIQDVMLEMSMRNYVGIAPQAAQGSVKSGFFWEQDYDGIETAYESVLNAVDQARLRFNVAPQRIFLAGMGDGGTMAFRLAFERPDVFAGVISINGPIPSDQAPLNEWFQCRNVPVFWAHGRRSKHFCQDDLCRQLKLLHIAGFSVTLRQYPQNDLLCPKTLGDVNNWVMEMIDTAITD